MPTTARETHSPEPWRHDPADGAIIIAGPLDRPVAIAEVFHVGGAEAANARLMRAAPEMLTFVRNIAARDGQHVFHLSPGAPHAPDCPPCVARALLARIEGDRS